MSIELLRWIQDAVNAAILLPTANVYLPILPLSAYDGDMQQPKLHRDSTQTDGDGLFFEFLSYLVSELVPEPDRHVVRQVLATNETFRYLLFRVGLYKRDPSIDVKLAADVLEIFLGAFDRVTTTTERTAVVQWMRDVVGPFIAVALNARLSFSTVGQKHGIDTSQNPRFTKKTAESLGLQRLGLQWHFIPNLPVFGFYLLFFLSQLNIDFYLIITLPIFLLCVFYNIWSSA